MKTPEVTGQPARYLDLIAQFAFGIEHRPGTSHGNCDGLSRRPEGSSEPSITPPDERIEETKERRVMEISMVEPNRTYQEVYFEDALDEEDAVTYETELLSDVDEGRLLKIDSFNFKTDEEAEKLSAENISREQHDDEYLAFVIACKQRV